MPMARLPDHVWDEDTLWDASYAEILYDPKGEMEPGRSLLDMGGLLMDLQDLLGRKVDVVSVKGLRARIRDRVLREAVPV